ncbi:long-chain-fatty-acid--CoA ligase [Caballeronia choica]|jgi:3-(methylthio)propionyl---CoA ligase|uniref:Long-chain-fatty-acid--CoA ligase n=1 Tax=Caballeronia choica TaxID=326476 RepID=A0A158KLV0_9BURK|nr:3-(methylthio)propionyl-CoA ligase [Caballeronia choica]SAL82116.1 long-chain-fatty-acid--CoA ligase [Caballeronia choica]
MFGSMMDRPLLVSSLLEHAERQFGSTEIVSRETSGALHRYTFLEAAKRSRQLACALAQLGVTHGGRVASLAWNNHRHLEAYFGVSGSGAVLHTCNPRLHPEQLAYILNHAEDEVLLFDTTFLPLVESIAAHCPMIRQYVLLGGGQDMPKDSRIPNLVCYENLLAACAGDFVWPEFDERTASTLCYTSGTTGNPKGVLYSHRSTILHTFAVSLPDTLSLSAHDCLLPVVPMFHVNAWGLPYAAAMNGCKLVLPGPKLDGASLYELIEGERVTCSAGVPTIWLGLTQHMEQHDLSLSTMNRTVVGGAAMPEALIRTWTQKFGVEVRHAWGMTETSPVGTQGSLLPKHANLTVEQQCAQRAKQGRAVFGVEMRTIDADGNEQPRDGKAIGELVVRGPWIAAAYFKGEKPALRDGWFPTGDIATIDADGYMHITDRVKDVIKSGGEWISSIDLENAAVGHPAVLMAAVIGLRHPKWDERPVMFIVTKPGQTVDKAEILAYLADKVAKWWLPDEVIFLDALPLGATGKVQKMELRHQYADMLDCPA